MTTPLLAYKKGIKKRDFVAELEAHARADNFLKGTYDKGEKGCAVGCSLKSVAKLKGITLTPSDHREYEAHLGIPEWLARLEDTLFEGMTLERSKTWPVEFAKAIRIGSNLEKAKMPFLVMVLEHSLSSLDACVYDEAAHPQVKAAIEGSRAAVKQMIAAQKSGNEADIQAARSAAESAAWSARSAARSADSAAWSAWPAAWSARSAAWSARSAAWSAESAAWSAESAAWSAESAYDYYGNRLIEILRELPDERKGGSK
jgi:hypothetical protein